jgi:hypothetical protein
MPTQTARPVRAAPAGLGPAASNGVQAVAGPAHHL